MTASMLSNLFMYQLLLINRLSVCIGIVFFFVSIGGVYAVTMQKAHYICSNAGQTIIGSSPCSRI